MEDYIFFICILYLISSLSIEGLGFYVLMLHIGVSNSAMEESINSISSVPALKNVGQSTKDGILGTASAPIHMVTAETSNFKEQLWRTFRTIAVSFLVISGVGALIEDRGLSKGLATSKIKLNYLYSENCYFSVKWIKLFFCHKSQQALVYMRRCSQAWILVQNLVM